MIGIPKKGTYHHYVWRFDDIQRSFLQSRMIIQRTYNLPLYVITTKYKYPQ